MQDRFLVRVAVYLILEQNGKMLLSLRQNTGYGDGFYSFVSGHVEAHESVKEAVIREAKEEIGIEVAPDDLTCVHVMYRIDKVAVVTYANFYFRCAKWRGNPLNCEPTKCGHVEFFAPSELPDNIIDQVKQALKEIARGSCFSEHGLN